MKKINSEISIDLPNIKAKWGTIDKKNPSSMYLEVGGYITPKNEEEDYRPNIQKIDREVKDVVKSAIISTDTINNNFIFVSDVADTRILYGKKSYLSFQIHIGRKKGVENRPFKEVVGDINGKWQHIYSDILSIIEENGFECSKTKN